VDEPDFAHPTERELARVFDEHGIRWEYEPRTFVLSRNPDGERQGGVHADLFLPKQGVYIELTVMRQTLTSRKQRKARRVRELYDVPVEIMVRRDVLRLSHRWQLHRLRHAALQKAA
jgi:hypothetical protein